MNRNYTKPGLLFILVAALLVVSTTFTFTQAQDSAEQTEEARQPQEAAQTEPTPPAEQPPSEEQRVEEQPVEPTTEPVIPPTTVPVEVLPTTVPVDVQPTIEQPVEPTIELPVDEVPGAATEIIPPVVQPTLVLPEQTLPTAEPEPIYLPFRESFSSNTGWIANGTWSFVDDGQGNAGWFADSASGNSESTLEYAAPIMVRGVNHPQIVLRQRGTLSSADVIAVEVRLIDTDSWTPVDVQLGQDVSADWSARFIDLNAYNGQTVSLRLRVASTGSGDGSTGYWLDELAIVEYTEQTIPTIAPTPEIRPTSVPLVIPTSVSPTQQTVVNANTRAMAPQAMVAAVAVGTGLTGRYFDNIDFTNRIVTRTDSTVNFYWHESAPAAGVAPDTFAVRWVGQVVPRYSEVYTFYTNSDDGVRLWVNGQPLVNNWTNHGPTENSGTVALTAGVPYAIRIEYYDNDMSATMTLSWSSASQPKEIVPQTQLFPATTSTEPPATSVPTNTPVSSRTASGLTATYYDNMNFSGRAASRVDSTVNFFWHESAPIPNVAPDTFSARWTGHVVPRYSEVYTFYTNSDDGVRLWVNGQRIINNWSDHGPTENSGTIRLRANQHYAIRLEYYDNNMSATLTLSWSSAHQAKQIIPRSRLIPSNGGTPQPTVTVVPTNPVVATNTAVPAATNVPTNTPVPAATNVPTNTPVPAATNVPTNGNGTGLAARYFDNVDLTNLLATRIDPTVNFSWGDGAPSAGIAPDSFSARWDGQVVPRYSETYTFYTNSDDGVRLWVNGQQIVNNWTNHGPTENSGTIALVAGQRYDIRLEYYDYNVFSIISLSWSSQSQPKEIVPQTQLFPAAITDPLPQPTNTAVPTNTPLPISTAVPTQTQQSSGSTIPAPPALETAQGTVIALWDWSDPNIQIFAQPNGAPEIGPVSSNDVAADGQGAYTRIVNASSGDRVVEFMVNHDYVQRGWGTAARLFIRNWGYLQPYYDQEIQTDFYMRVPQLPVVPVNNPNLVFGLGQQFKHADGVIWAMDAERAPDGSGVSPYIWWPRGTGVVYPQAPFEYQQGVWHKVRVNSLLHNVTGWVEIRIDDQLVFRFDGNTSEVWGGGIGLALYIRDIAGEMRVQFSDWRLQVL